MLLPILGGQTALNLTVQLENQGIFKIWYKSTGSFTEAISKAEDRELFKEAMLRVGIDVPQSDRAYSLDEAKSCQWGGFL